VQQRDRIISLALLLLALATPVLFLTGYALNGQEILSRSTPHLVVAFVCLSIGAGASAYLLLQRNPLFVRLVAAVALVVLLGSVSYVRVAWGQNMSRAIAQLRREPFAAGQVGVLLCPTDQSAGALRQARDLQQLIERTVDGAQLGDRIEAQIAYPVSSADQALVLASDRRASVVVWSQETTYHGQVTAAYHLTSPGVATANISAEPLDLLLVLLTQGTFDLERTYEQDASGIQSLARETIVPMAIGMAFWAADDPLMAATLFDKALLAQGLTEEERQAIHRYLAGAMLALSRDDLAEQHLQQAGDGAAVAVGQGAVAILRREWDDAEDAFLHALEIEPGNIAAYCGLSSVYATKLQAERAVQAAQKAIALNNELAAPYAFLGMALERTGDIEGAQQAYQRAAVFSGGNIGLYNATTARSQTVQKNPPTPVPTATMRPTPSITPYPTSALYTVESGDTLAKIADKFGVTVDEIMELNKISNRNAIAVGEVLKIPASID